MLADRSHQGVALVPNLFGKPTIIVVGGGKLNQAQDEVVTGYPYVESAQVIWIQNTAWILYYF